ncbi:MAG: hypothetical protein ACLRPV_12810 [Lacrimispora saccharolytica]
MAKKVVTFGEIMLRLAPEGYYRFVQADTYGATYGGGESKRSSFPGQLRIRCKLRSRKLRNTRSDRLAVNSLRKIWM